MEDCTVPDHTAGQPHPELIRGARAQVLAHICSTAHAEQRDRQNGGWIARVRVQKPSMAQYQLKNEWKAAQRIHNLVKPHAWGLEHSQQRKQPLTGGRGRSIPARIPTGGALAQPAQAHRRLRGLAPHVPSQHPVVWHHASSSRCRCHRWGAMESSEDAPMRRDARVPPVRTSACA